MIEGYTSGIDAWRVRGRPLVNWKDSQLKYVRERERERLEYPSMKCMDRGKWRLLLSPPHRGSSKEQAPTETKLLHEDSEFSYERK